MRLSDGIKQAYDRQWSMINTFTVEIHMSGNMSDMVGGSFNDSINLNIISVNTPDFANTPIESFIANEWFIHNGRDEMYRFNITFRDQNQMALYRKFQKIYEFTKNNYFDDCAMSIHIIKDGDWYAENDLTIMELHGTLIEAVSNISFSNDTEQQIAEFTVSFKCNKPLFNN